MAPDPHERRSATTAEVVAAAGVTDSTVMKWSKRGLLPPFKVVYGGKRGRTARWPLHAPEQAAWVRNRLEAGLGLDEIQEELERGEFTPSSDAEQ